jgi:hypothetical protein
MMISTYLIIYLNLKLPWEVYSCIPMDPTISNPHLKKVVNCRNNKKCHKTFMLELPSTRQSYTPNKYFSKKNHNKQPRMSKIQQENRYHPTFSFNYNANYPKKYKLPSSIEVVSFYCRCPPCCYNYHLKVI